MEKRTLGQGRWPSSRGFWAAWVVVVAIDLLALAGLMRLEYDDGLLRTFQSDNRAFADFVTFNRSFGGQGEDILLLVESDDFTRPGQLAALRDFVIELQLDDAVAAVVSPFSLPIPDGSDRPARLDPAPALSQAALAAYLDGAFARQPALARFLSPDAGSALVAVQGAAASDKRLMARIDADAAETLDRAGIAMTQTGYSVIRAGVVDRLIGDFIMLNITGALSGTVIAAIALQSLVLALLTILASGTALLWVLGMMGLAGVGVNVITVALPVLILVLSLADALHLSFETRRQVRSGNARAIPSALRRVGPACVMAAVTTAIAFGVLALSPSALIAEMGVAGALAALISVLAVLIVHPLLHATLGRTWRLDALFSGRRGVPTPLARWTWLVALGYRRPRTCCAGALVALAVSGALYATAVPNFSLFENTRADDPARLALTRISTTFGPTAALHFIVPLDPANPGAGLSRAAGILSRHALGHEVLSLAIAADEAERMPPALRNRWLAGDGRAGLVSVAFDYTDAATTRRLARAIAAGLAADPDAGPLAGARATGVEAMSSFVSADMLRDLNRCFLIAVAASGVLIALWLRDPLAGLVALVPNVLPIALVGAWLALSGRGLEFASGIALTIAFGLAIDDTVHVLNRLRLDLGGTVWARRGAVLASVYRVLPVLVITSAVLSVGLASTRFAALPMVVYFGTLSIVVFVLALVADLVVLPACLIALASWRLARQGGRDARSGRPE